MCYDNLQSIDEKKRFRQNDELRICVDAVTMTISQKKTTVAALQAVTELKVETALPDQNEKGL